MPIDDSIEPSLPLKFEIEKINRLVLDCDDVETLRQIALNLIEMYKKKSAIAQWYSKRAAEAEESLIHFQNSFHTGLNP